MDRRFRLSTWFIISVLIGVICSILHRIMDKGVEFPYHNYWWAFLHLYQYYSYFLYAVTASQLLFAAARIMLTRGIKFMMENKYATFLLLERECTWVKPFTLGRSFSIQYCPHLVASVITEYSRGTNPTVVRSTLRQRLLRHATLPIPDSMITQIMDGSERVAQWAIEQMDFVSRQPNLPVLVLVEDLS